MFGEQQRFMLLLWHPRVAAHAVPGVPIVIGANASFRNGHCTIRRRPGSASITIMP